MKYSVTTALVSGLTLMSSFSGVSAAPVNVTAGAVAAVIKEMSGVPNHSNTTHLVKRQSGHYVEQGTNGGSDTASAAGGASNLASIANKALGLVTYITNKQHKAEREWVSKTIDLAMELNPDWNVLIFHDQQSEIKWNYGYSTHAHYELDLPNTDGTKGYEIWLLDDADFVLHGDGGYENWGIGGDFERSNVRGTDDHQQHFVEFKMRRSDGDSPPKGWGSIDVLAGPRD